MTTKHKIQVASGLVIGASIAHAVFACTAAQQKTVLDVVHVSTHVCKYIAELKCKPALLALCEAGHDVSEAMREAAEADSACPLDGGADGR